MYVLTIENSTKESEVYTVLEGSTVVFSYEEKAILYGRYDGESKKKELGFFFGFFFSCGFHLLWFSAHE